MDKDLIYIVLAINLVLAIVFYLQKRCEIPIFISLFNIMVQYRILSLELGLSNFVNFNYQINFVFTLEMAYEVATLILVGSSTMQYMVMYFYKKPQKLVPDSNEYLKNFLLQRKTIIFIGLGIFTFFQIVLHNVENSYSYLTKLANSSFILLFFMIFIVTKVSNTQIKIIYLVSFLCIAFISYSPELRFQFLGWMIPVGYFVTRNIKPINKLWFMAAGLFAILVIFSAARVLRYSNAESRSLSIDELYEESVDRMEESDDVNFIDGFMMMYQVYPKYLDYTYGFDHLNILLRPIPRNFWPDKPLAGWFQNYQKKYGLEKTTVGFSPTIYGVFYGEMGAEGVVIFSILWAFFLVWLYRYINQFRSDLSWVLTGVLLTALIPLFRSGDLPGDVAVVLMSYWPIIYFVYKYKQFVKKQLLLEKV
ncbi:hypothetical protein CHU_0867 [Cytophaga hutchinsonii ATCC 33406]|uniref:Oligosaccharide repeat unit polymerase n=2 Tax=Cytophaga hutchinsonii TaxID=985 RepID=A0A6N4SPF0_CYTH3|nr:hypothetical protein CHU_0867 [Cytophaga hutchinsonii ATCC 33406]